MFTPRLLGRFLAGLAFLLMMAWLPPAPALAQDSPSCARCITWTWSTSSGSRRTWWPPGRPRRGALRRGDRLQPDQRGRRLPAGLPVRGQRAVLHIDEQQQGQGQAGPRPAHDRRLLPARGPRTWPSWSASSRRRDPADLGGDQPEQPISLESVPGRVAFTRAMAARNEGDFPGAIRYFTAAIEVAPDNGFFRYWRADALMRLDEFDAIADYNGALALLPGDRPSLIGRGVAWLWKESWQAAPRTPPLSSTPRCARSPDRLGLPRPGRRPRQPGPARPGHLGLPVLPLARAAGPRPPHDRALDRRAEPCHERGGAGPEGHATPGRNTPSPRRPLAPGRCMPARTAQGRGMLRVTRKDAPSAACPAGVIQEGPPGCRVSVVIPALNEAANLPHVLPRIPPWVHEVLLVDGHSTDGTAEVAQRLYRDPPGQAGGARASSSGSPPPGAT